LEGVIHFALQNGWQRPGEVDPNRLLLDNKKDMFRSLNKAVGIVLFLWVFSLALPEVYQLSLKVVIRGLTIVNNLLDHVEREQSPLL
jgi:hypothetical protein